MKRLLAAAAVALVGTSYMVGRVTAPGAVVEQASAAHCYVIRAENNEAQLVETVCPADNAPTATVTPAATQTAMPPTPTKVPTTASATPSPELTCEGYPCWLTVDRLYTAVNRVWVCRGAQPCGSVPEYQIRLREIGEVVHVLCLFEETAGGALWASETKCASAEYWSAVHYNGRVYLQLSGE